ncbi:MAG: DUF751 family protein [Kaiparowitsia implicata GSE-PSE-MK54-09C]|jgi:hypothetical protein|nr:DUF751 family protein [Kaiparowitsia implicata GSE-PSE-MK54-09C]
MQDFFNNISRYPRYFISFTLGVLLTLFQPFRPLFQRPSTAILASVLLLAAFAFLTFTLRAMLGLNAVQPALY